jgi:hypothetical protein
LGSTYGELGLDLRQSIAGYAIRNLEVGIVLDRQDASCCGCGLALLGSRESKGRDGQGKEESGLEKHLVGYTVFLTSGCWSIVNEGKRCRENKKDSPAVTERRISKKGQTMKKHRALEWMMSQNKIVSGTTESPSIYGIFIGVLALDIGYC